MGLKRFIASQSLLWILMAIGMLLVPRQFVGFFGADLSAGGVVLARLFAAELTALAFVSYFETARNWPTVPPMAWLGYTLSNGIGFGSTLVATLSGVFNQRGWIVVAAYFLYFIVFLIVLIRNPRENRP